jgi:hypothetical protein
VMESGKIYDKNSIVRALCHEERVRWHTAERILIELTRTGFLSAGFGTYELVGTGFNCLGRR